MTDTPYAPLARPQGSFAVRARLQSLYGFRPDGAHWDRVKSLLAPHVVRCKTCRATGLHGTYGGLGWNTCPDCHGLGSAYDIPLDEVEALRQIIIGQYPSAAIPGWQFGRVIRLPAIDLRTGAVIDLAPQEDEEPRQMELALS